MFWPPSLAPGDLVCAVLKDNSKIIHWRVETGGNGVQVEATPCHPSGDMSRRFDIHFNIPMNAYHDGRIVP